MSVKQFMYLNLRKGTYTKSQREWLLQKAVSGLDQQEVLEIHSFAPVTGYGRPELPVGLSCVTFRDRTNHVVSQVYSGSSYNGLQNDNGLQEKKELLFFIDGRCIDGDKVTRQVMHLLHKLYAFTPAIDGLVIWANEVPWRLFQSLDDEEMSFYVDEVRGLGLVITISVDEMKDGLQTRKSAL
ncbi:hypothetical protein [Alicyclobacillus mengziensis]|uniref:Uncharacterized protein n=1 Tax=Alicyclobacillus mengziensis TaxID=2931921 RepID=A0A9X7W099_9BACL|nr:hypothetical protein [Alicyclobacillus mengziensis]QSO48067.1 hypothetical protein JZ786_03355 [Alicyclobacillus mengziensis]